MINHISWTQFVFTLGFFALAYYLYLFYRFAKKEEHKEYQQEQENFDPPYNGEEAMVTDETFEMAEILIAKLTECIQAIGDRELLKLRLRSEILAYPELNTPAFRMGINNRIMTELENNGSVTLTEREIEDLW